MTQDVRRDSSLEGPLSTALIAGRKFFTRATVSDDQRALFTEGGRTGDAFYRDRPAEVARDDVVEPGVEVLELRPGRAGDLLGGLGWTSRDRSSTC